jgi:hypothetical protein
MVHCITICGVLQVWGMDFMNSLNIKRRGSPLLCGQYWINATLLELLRQLLK